MSSPLWQGERRERGCHGESSLYDVCLGFDCLNVVFWSRALQLLEMVIFLVFALSSPWFGCVRVLNFLVFWLVTSVAGRAVCSGMAGCLCLLLVGLIHVGPLLSLTRLRLLLESAQGCLSLLVTRVGLGGHSCHVWCSWPAQPLDGCQGRRPWCAVWYSGCLVPFVLAVPCVFDGRAWGNAQGPELEEDASRIFPRSQAPYAGQN